MKKLIKKICLAIGKIIKLIDKIIITPIMKLFLILKSFFEKNNKVIEKIFSNQKSLVVISLLIAFYVFV